MVLSIPFKKCFLLVFLRSFFQKLYEKKLQYNFLYFFQDVLYKLYERKHFLLKEVFNISGYFNSTHVKRMKYSRFIKRYSFVNRQEVWILQVWLNMSENAWIVWNMSEHIKEAKTFLNMAELYLNIL